MTPVLSFSDYETERLSTVNRWGFGLDRILRFVFLRGRLCRGYERSIWCDPPEVGDPSLEFLWGVAVSDLEPFTAARRRTAFGSA
jgi:hypothetical protein